MRMSRNIHPKLRSISLPVGWHVFSFFVFCTLGTCGSSGRVSMLGACLSHVFLGHDFISCGSRLVEFYISEASLSEVL